MRADFLPGFVLELHDANGVAFPEHPLGPDDDALPDKTVATYLEIPAGARYIIDVRRTPAFKHSGEDLDLSVSADGKWIHKPVSHPGAHRTFEGRRFGAGNQWRRHHYTFAQLTTTEDHANETWKATAKALGEIKIKVIRCKQLPTQFERRDSAFHGSTGFNSGVPEKALKGRSVSTHVDYQAEGVPCRKPTRHVYSYPFGKKPIATFIFKYATRRDLQSQGVIARSPSPVPLEERDPNTLSLEETRQLLTRVQQQRDEMSKKIKRERQDSAEADIRCDGNDSDGEVEVVHKRRRAVKVETIDLTADDD